MSYNEQYIAQLIFKYFRGELDASGRIELQRWLDASPLNRDFFYSLEKENTILSILEENERDKKANIQQVIFQKILSKIEEDMPVSSISVAPKRGLIIQRWWKYAAVILLVVSAGTVLWLNNRKPAAEQVVLASDKSVKDDVLPGSNRAMLTLSDGRTVYLDPESGQMIEENGTAISNNNGELSYSQSDVAVTNKMSTPKGGQYKIVLSDGTRVWLNSASSITYPTLFNASKREVSVTGEVYFEVAENKKLPFIVKIPGGSQIEVLGTHFNVNVYEDELDQATTLVEGSIRMSYKNEKVLITPGQQAVMKNNSDGSQQSFQLQQANIEQVLAWRSNFFVFNKADLSSVMRQLSRWYDLDIVYEGKISQRSFQGKIPRDIPLSKVLNALEKLEINFEIKDKTLIVSP